jgi:predicted TIM-barrel fold metal-dependent hydrolase
MTVEEYTPKSSLVVPGAPVKRAKFPFVDIHSHQNSMMSPAQMDKLVTEMDALNMPVMINLSGGFGQRFREGVKNMKSKYPKRFVVFCNLDLTNLDDPNYPARAAKTLEEDIQAGCEGLKFFKPFGMSTKDASGKRIPVTDARFDPSFRVVAKYKIPVLIHTADPKQFWDPVDKFNERYVELTQYKNRRHDAARDGKWEDLMEEAYSLFRKNKDVNFIHPHLGWLGGDLGKMSKLFDEMPNYHVDISAVIAELGRQPRMAKQWFTKYQDRILMGKDSYRFDEYFTYFRVLESEDEYFDYHNTRHAFWKMYGIGLPDPILKKVYYKNALKLLPKVDKSLFPK